MITTNNNYKQYESFLYEAGTNMQYENRSQIATGGFWQKSGYLYLSGENGACPPTRSGLIHPLLNRGTA